MENSSEFSAQNNTNTEKEGPVKDPLFLAIDGLQDCEASDPIKRIVMDLFIRLDFAETALDDVVTILNRKGLVTEQDIHKIIKERTINAWG